MPRSNYTVATYPAHKTDQTETDWIWLNVFDINGVNMHSTIVREKDLPQEIAIAIERAVMSLYERKL